MGRKVLIAIALSSLVMIGGTIWKWVSDSNRVVALKIATGGKTGDYYAFGQVLRQAIAKHQSHIQLKVILTNGATDNMQRLENRQVQLALTQNDTPALPSARAIALLYPEVFHLIVAEKSNIKSVTDLKGKRIALMPKGSGSYDAFWILAQHYDFKPGDVQTIPLSPIEAQKAFRQGKVDGIFRTASIGNQWTKELLKITPARMIPIDQAAAMKISQPYLGQSIIPKGTYKANPAIPAQNLPTVGVQATLLTHKDIDADLIHEITSILFEYRQDLVTLDPKAATISQPNVGQNLGLPLHPGAKDYYDREKPDFIVANADAIALLISVVTLIGSGLWSLRSSFLAKQKNRADMYNLEIIVLVEKARSTDNLEELAAIQQHLFEIFRKVVEDLDLDRITTECFQSFAFSWQVAINTVHHQEMLALSLQGKSKISKAQWLQDSG